MRLKSSSVFILALIVVSLLIAGCTTNNTQPLPKAPGTPAPNTAPQGSGLPLRLNGDTLTFGPFSSFNRGIDYFWLADGKRMLVCVSAQDAGQQLWLVDVPQKASRMLREARQAEAIFPLGFAGPEKVVIIEIPRDPGGKNAIYTVDFSANSTKVQLVAEVPGRAKRQAITRDGKYVTVHHTDGASGKLTRLDTSTNTAKELVAGLPIDDGLYPVWFSPDGTQAAMPERSGSGRETRIKLVNLLTGETRTTQYFVRALDTVKWSDDGKYFAFKVADGSHKMMESGDFYVVLSQKLRIASSNGSVVKDASVPQGRLVGDIAWLNSTTLVARERKSVSEAGLSWVVGLDGVFAAAQPAQAAVLSEPLSYPMPKGSSSAYTASVRGWQDQGRAPSQELIIMPKK